MRYIKFKSKQYYVNRKAERFLSYIKTGPNKIMEIGCSNGDLGAAIRASERATELIGVELYPEAACKAKNYFDYVYVGDIEKINLQYEKYFDVIICGDVLEHLIDPWKMLNNINKWLKDDGLLLITIPNIRNFGVIYDLVVKGKWEYCNCGGILDDTHIRFFTRRSMSQALKDSNFRLLKTKFIIYGKRYRLINILTLKCFSEFIGYQILFVVQNVKKNEKEALDKITSEKVIVNI